MERELTLVTLLLDFKLLGQILVLLPLDFGTDRTIVDKVTCIANLLLVEVGLFQDSVIEEIVGGELENELEARGGIGSGEVFDANINEVLQCSGIPIRDDLIEDGVIAESGKPELGDTIGTGLLALFRRGIEFLILLEGNLFTGFDLISSGLRGTSNDLLSALIQRLVEFSILKKGGGSTYVSMRVIGIQKI